MAEHATQHLIVFDDQGNALYSLINNHGPENAAAFLYGRPGEPGCIAHTAQHLGAPDRCVVVDLDLSDFDEKERGECMRKLHHCRATLSRRKSAASLDSIVFFQDDDLRLVRRSLPANTRARVIEAPASFEHERFDVRGNRKDK